MRAGKSDLVVGTLITVRLISNFKEISADQTVSMLFSVHSSMTSFSCLCGLCPVHGAIFRKRGAGEVVPPWVPYALTALFLGACTLQRQGIAWAPPFPLIFSKKAALCTPVADYLFDFDSQGLITVHSFNCFQTLDISWLLLFELFGRVFGILSNLFEIPLVNYGKLSSAGSIDSGSSPPGVHQIGGSNFGQVCAA